MGLKLMRSTAIDGIDEDDKFPGRLLLVVDAVLFGSQGCKYSQWFICSSPRKHASSDHYYDYNTAGRPKAITREGWRGQMIQKKEEKKTHVKGGSRFEQDQQRRWYRWWRWVVGYLPATLEWSRHKCCFLFLRHWKPHRFGLYLFVVYICIPFEYINRPLPSALLLVWWWRWKSDRQSIIHRNVAVFSEFYTPSPLVLAHLVGKTNVEL